VFQPTLQHATVKIITFSQELAKGVLIATLVINMLGGTVG